MAEPDVDDDLFADLYDGDGDTGAVEPPPSIPTEAHSAEEAVLADDVAPVEALPAQPPETSNDGQNGEYEYDSGNYSGQHGRMPASADMLVEERPIGIKEDG